MKFSTIALACALVIGTASAAVAAFGDTARVSSGTVSAYTLTKPVWSSCTVTGAGKKTATIVWNEVSSPIPLDYTAVAIDTTGVLGSITLTITDNGATRQVAVTSSVLAIGTWDVHITAKLPGGTWTSPYLTQQVTFVSSIIGNCGSHA
jgi:hypothetical protein